MKLVRKLALPLGIVIVLLAAFVVYMNRTWQGEFEMSSTIYIDEPIEKVWQVTGVEFARIDQWDANIDYSYGEGEGINGSTVLKRVCEANVTGLAQITEELIEFEPDNYRLKYKAYGDFPPMIVSGTNEWTHVRSGAGTEMTMRGRTQLKGFLGWAIKPIMQRQGSTLLGQVQEELRHYVETGNPHPRKVTAIEAYEQKNQR